MEQKKKDLLIASGVVLAFIAVILILILSVQFNLKKRFEEYKKSEEYRKEALEHCRKLKMGYCEMGHTPTKSDYLTDKCFRNGSNILENPYSCPPNSTSSKS